MKFEKFWNILQNELEIEKKLTTLKFHREFIAYFRDEQTIIIKPKLGNKLLILTSKDMLFVWNKAKTLNSSERFSVKYYRHKIGTSSYAVTFLKNFLNDQKIE